MLKILTMGEDNVIKYFLGQWYIIHNEHFRVITVKRLPFENIKADDMTNLSWYLQKISPRHVVAINKKASLR